MIHGIRAGRRANPEWVILQIDVANAFNTICRIVLFDELVKGPFAPMVPFLLSLYGAPSSLLYRADTTRHTLWSRTGVRQGDPLGSFLYALAQQPALERMKAQHLDVFVVSYADDTYVMGDIKAVGKAYTTLQSELECSGMQTSVVKCEWYSPSGPQPTQGNPLYSMEEVKDGLVVVGSPVGGSAFVEAAVKAKRGSDEPVLAALPGAWVTALPSRPDLRMSSDDWAIAANLRLGRDIPHVLQTEKCSCGAKFSEVYAPGHALRCATGYVPSIAHDAIVNCTALLCRELGCAQL
ncbi:hypothetical protein CLOP_g21266 [Closterium sp. NIES-67]|nr:hypothetical protein CLOP_g21266 [Closterium sp. NIES-67]